MSTCKQQREEIKRKRRRCCITEIEWVLLRFISLPLYILKRQAAAIAAATVCMCARLYPCVLSLKHSTRVQHKHVSNEEKNSFVPIIPMMTVETKKNSWIECTIKSAPTKQEEAEAEAEAKADKERVVKRTRIKFVSIYLLLLLLLLCYCRHYWPQLKNQYCTKLCWMGVLKIEEKRPVCECVDLRINSYYEINLLVIFFRSIG